MRQASKAKARGEDLDDEELEDIEELRKAGFLKEAKEGSALAAAKPKPEAKHGERRIKRTIAFLDDHGNKQTRTIVYTDKDKVGPRMFALHLSSSRRLVAALAFSCEPVSVVRPRPSQWLC